MSGAGVDGNATLFGLGVPELHQPWPNLEPDIPIS